MSSRKTAYILAIVAVALIIAGFLVPPLGVIDPSVLKGVGEIIGIIAILFAWDAVDKGIDTKITHGQTKVEFTNDDDRRGGGEGNAQRKDRDDTDDNTNTEQYDYNT